METLIPIGGLVSPKSRLILCGDPQQLGPVVTVHFTKFFGYGILFINLVSNSFYFLDNSMIARLKEMDVYKNDPYV